MTRGLFLARRFLVPAGGEGHSPPPAIPETVKQKVWPDGIALVVFSCRRLTGRAAGSPPKSYTFRRAVVVSTFVFSFVLSAFTYRYAPAHPRFFAARSMNTLWAVSTACQVLVLALYPLVW